MASVTKSCVFPVLVRWVLTLSNSGFTSLQLISAANETVRYFDAFNMEIKETNGIVQLVSNVPIDGTSSTYEVRVEFRILSFCDVASENTNTDEMIFRN